MTKLTKKIEVAEQKIAAEEVKATPQSYLVRWKGGEERFDSLSMAEYAVRTHVGGHIV
jgi:hypothetical protein